MPQKNASQDFDAFQLSLTLVSEEKLGQLLAGVRNALPEDALTRQNADYVGARKLIVELRELLRKPSPPVPWTRCYEKAFDAFERLKRAKRLDDPVASLQLAVLVELFSARSEAFGNGKPSDSVELGELEDEVAERETPGLEGELRLQ